MYMFMFNGNQLATAVCGRNSHLILSLQQYVIDITTDLSLAGPWFAIQISQFSLCSSLLCKTYILLHSLLLLLFSSLCVCEFVHTVTFFWPKVLSNFYDPCNCIATILFYLSILLHFKLIVPKCKYSWTGLVVQSDVLLEKTGAIAIIVSSITWLL